MIKIRLWHYALLPYLPRQQMLSQLSECVEISKDIYEKGTTNHILINKIMDYPIQEFQYYCELVINEMKTRGYNVKDVTIQKLEKYLDCKFPCTPFGGIELFPNWHNTRYLVQNIMNLQEKYDCKGITFDEWDKIYHKFYKYLNY